MGKTILHGFSKLSKTEKIAVLSQQLSLPHLAEELQSYNHPIHQKLFDGFSENTLSNFYLPFGIAPNFLINGDMFHVPMVIEESSVVAAAAAAAKFWLDYGGFHARVMATQKTGQVHFIFSGNKQPLFQQWETIKERLTESTETLTANMKKRGGGISSIHLVDCTWSMNGYFRLDISFETVDSMGANFINSVLEAMGKTLVDYCSDHFSGENSCEIIMSILSNYTPDCRVKCYVEAPVSAFDKIGGDMGAGKFVEKFISAVEIAKIDIGRAVTHNKGIMNGADAVVLATGNDFRAMEADVHAYSCRSGRYSSLSTVEIQNDTFIFSVELPVVVGTVGGLTSLHPLAKLSLDMLGNPSAKQLMAIVAATGLASHFSAIKALVTSGIQSGHMKMHLSNILQQLNVSKEEEAEALRWFEDKTVSYSGVRKFLTKLRNPLGL